MATFNWATCTIDMSNRNGGLGNAARDTIAALPNDEQATISCVHEYVHFLQAMGSYPAFVMLAELFDIATIGSLLMQNVLVAGRQAVQGFYPVVGFLSRQPDHAGNGCRICPRLETLLHEAKAWILPQSSMYAGREVSWELASQRIASGTFEDTFDGFVTPSGRFRAFNVGFLAENMARQIDRWLARNERYAHTWPPTIEEAEVYNGLRTILAQPRYQHNVTNQTIERIVVTVCSLALVSGRPDEATRQMLRRLGQPRNCGILTQDVAIELRDTLVANGMLNADMFNARMADIENGPPRNMLRVEYVGVYEQLNLLRNVVNTVLETPHYFADDGVTWQLCVNWMRRFGLPPVEASDGDVQNIAGVPTRDCISSLLRQTMRVFT